jgi:hypothetical protein
MCEFFFYVIFMCCVIWLSMTYVNGCFKKNKGYSVLVYTIKGNQKNIEQFSFVGDDRDKKRQSQRSGGRKGECAFFNFTISVQQDGSVCS